MIFQWYSVKNQWILVQILFKIPWFSLIFVWKNMNLHVLIDKNHQNRSKTIKNWKIHPGAFSKFFSIFLVKCDFSHFSPLFPSAPWRHFRDFTRFCKNLDFPISGFWRFHGKSIFFEKLLRNDPKFVFLWKIIILGMSKFFLPLNNFFIIFREIFRFSDRLFA